MTITVRATALGPLRLSARASSPVADARLGDNSSSATARVVPPDSVRGRGVRPSFGTFFRPPVLVEVDAISGPDGRDAAGTFFTAYSPLDRFNPGLEVRGRVVCLAVVGNRATVGAVVEETRNAPPDRPFAPGSGIALIVTDNGDPGPDQDTMLTYFPAEPPSDCAVPWPGQNAPEIPLSEGNFVVHDERP